MQTVFLLALLSATCLSKGGSRIKYLATIALCAVCPLIPFLLFGPPAHPNFKNPILYSLMNPLETLTIIARNLGEFKSEQLLPLVLLSWIPAIFCYIVKDEKSFPKNKFLWFSFIFALFSWFPLSHDVIFPRYSVLFLLIGYVASAPVLAWFETKYVKLFWTGLLFIFLKVFYQNDSMSAIAEYPLWTLAFLSVSLAMMLGLSEARHRATLGLLCLITLSIFIKNLQMGDRGFERFDMRSSERMKLLKAIIEETGWDYKTFRERAFIIGAHREDEYQFVFSQIQSKEYQMEKQESLQHPSGVLVINRNLADFIGNSPTESTPDWNGIRKEIPLEFYNAASDEQLRCVKLQKVGIYDICYYRFADPDVDFTWNNIGYAYVWKQEPLLQVTEPQGVVRVDSKKWIFFMNNCASFGPECTVYFVVSIEPNKFIEVKILGDPLANPNPAPNLFWYLTVLDLNLEVTCNDGSIITSTVVTRLGVQPDRRNGGFINGFLVPFQIRSSLKCKAPTELTISSENAYSTSRLPRSRTHTPLRIKWSSRAH